MLSPFFRRSRRTNVRKESKRTATSWSVVFLLHVDEYCARTRNTAFSTDRHLTLPRGETLFRRKLFLRLSFHGFPLFYDEVRCSTTRTRSREYRASKKKKKKESLGKTCMFRFDRKFRRITRGISTERDEFYERWTRPGSIPPPSSALLLSRKGEPVPLFNQRRFTPFFSFSCGQCSCKITPPPAVVARSSLEHWSHDQKGYTRSLQLATDVSSNLTLDRHRSLLFLSFTDSIHIVYPTFSTLCSILNRGEGKILLSLFDRETLFHSHSGVPCFLRRVFKQWFCLVARYCRNAVLPSFLDEFSGRPFIRMRRSFSTVILTESIGFSDSNILTWTSAIDRIWSQFFVSSPPMLNLLYDFNLNNWKWSTIWINIIVRFEVKFNPINF